MLFCGQDNKIANGVPDDRLSKLVMVPWYTHQFFIIYPKKVKYSANFS
jgi:hypothetical protein